MCCVQFPSTTYRTNFEQIYAEISVNAQIQLPKPTVSPKFPFLQVPFQHRFFSASIQGWSVGQVWEHYALNESQLALINTQTIFRSHWPCMESRIKQYNIIDQINLVWTLGENTSACWDMYESWQNSTCHNTCEKGLINPGPQNLD